MKTFSNMGVNELQITLDAYLYFKRRLTERLKEIAAVDTPDIVNERIDLNVKLAKTNRLIESIVQQINS